MISYLMRSEPDRTRIYNLHYKILIGTSLAVTENSVRLYKYDSQVDLGLRHNEMKTNWIRTSRLDEKKCDTYCGFINMDF